MISGREALHGLEQTIFGLRADEGRLDAALASANDEAARARRAEADGFRALARIKLDLLAQTELLSDLDSTERRALDMIAGERAMLAALERNGFAIEAVALDEIEKAGGSLRCCVAEIF